MPALVAGIHVFDVNVTLPWRGRVARRSEAEASGVG